MFNIWKYVLTDPSSGKDIGKWFEIVKETHYPFFTHNGRLFAVGHDKKTYLQIGSMSGTEMFFVLHKLNDAKG